MLNPGSTLYFKRKVVAVPHHPIPSLISSLISSLSLFPFLPPRGHRPARPRPPPLKLDHQPTQPALPLHPLAGPVGGVAPSALWTGNESCGGEGGGAGVWLTCRQVDGRAGDTQDLRYLICSLLMSH